MVLFRHRDSRGAYGNPASPSPSVPRFILCLHPFPPHTLHHDRLIHLPPFFFFFLILLTSFTPGRLCFFFVFSVFEKRYDDPKWALQRRLFDAVDRCRGFLFKFRGRGWYFPSTRLSSERFFSLEEEFLSLFGRLWFEGKERIVDKYFTLERYFYN